MDVDESTHVVICEFLLIWESS